MQIVRQSLSEQVCRELRGDIVTQKLAGGEKLLIRELETKYGVSSTPIREALSRLAQEGLVDHITNQSAKVVELTLKEMLDINDICALQDCYAVRLAMTTPHYEGLLGDLRAAIEKQAHHYRLSQSMADQIEHNNAFHRLFYNYVTNDRLRDMAERLGSLYLIIISKSMGDTYPVDSIREHQAIYDAVEAMNVEQAVSRMEYHFGKGRRRLIEVYESEAAEKAAKES